MEIANDQLLTAAALARRLRLPASWLKAEANAGRIPCLRAGRRVLFNADAVAQTLLQRASSRSNEVNKQ